MKEEAIKALGAKLDPRHIKQRKGPGGKTLDYLSGDHVIRTANKVFGHDGWSRETTEIRCVYEGKGQKQYECSYIATVCVTIHSHNNPMGSVGRSTIRQGTGYGDGMGFNPGKAHELACKEAETDAMKRAFMTFGDVFGLALYDTTHAHVMDQSEVEQKSKAESRKVYEAIQIDLSAAETVDELRSEWMAHKDEIASLPADWKKEITKLSQQRKLEIEQLEGPE